MRDKDVIKMIGKWLDKTLEKTQSLPPIFPGISNTRQVAKKRPKPTKNQLKALEEGRKILLMNHKQSQK